MTLVAKLRPEVGRGSSFGKVFIREWIGENGKRSRAGERRRQVARMYIFRGVNAEMIG